MKTKRKQPKNFKKQLKKGIVKTLFIPVDKKLSDKIFITLDNGLLISDKTLKQHITKIQFNNKMAIRGSSSFKNLDFRYSHEFSDAKIFELADSISKAENLKPTNEKTSNLSNLKTKGKIYHKGTDFIKCGLYNKLLRTHTLVILR